MTGRQQQYGLGPHGMSYHLAEGLHAMIWRQEATLSERLDLLGDIADTVDSIISVDKKISLADRETVRRMQLEIEKIYAMYIPSIESDPSMFMLRYQLESKRLKVRRSLLKIITKNKLVTQELVKTVAMNKPGKGEGQP